jgi:hypothetical protein
VTGSGASREELSREFARFSKEVFAHHSTLYSRLALGIADDAEMLALAAHAASTPVTNLLFAAAQFLLLGGAEHPVAEYYPNLVASPKSGDPYPAFRSFCLEHADEMCGILATRRVQTNEVRRCALLLPAFGLVAECAGKPLSLIEVGASAGLNLLFDRYAYDYGEGRTAGDLDSPVRIPCEIRGEKSIPLPPRTPEVASRTGLDLNPLDMRDPESGRWLEALIWPEEFAHRVPLLERAMEVARRKPPKLLRGDALDLLPESIKAAPEDSAICVFHTFTLNQFARKSRERFAATLAEHATERELYRVSVEWLGSETPLLKLSTFERGVERETTLARCDDHGEWIQWLAP